MRINNIQSINFGKIYKVTSNTENPDPKRVNPDVFEAVMDARGAISGLSKKQPRDKEVSRELGEFLKAQIVDWDGRVNGIALGHIGDSDYMFTGKDAEKFFSYRKESRQIIPDDMLYEKTKEFLSKLKQSRTVLNQKIAGCNQSIDSIGIIPNPDDEEREKQLIRKREQYMNELKVFQNHIDSVEECLKKCKYSYQAVYQRAKQETMVESGDFDEIAFRFGQFGELSSVEFLNKSNTPNAK